MGRSKKEGHDVPELEHDVSSMDPALFEDPVLLLEYLQAQDKDRGQVKNQIAQEKKISQNWVVPTIGYASKKMTQDEPSAIHRANRSRVPYGYLDSNGIIEINRTEAEAIRLIFALYDGGYNRTQISDRLYRTKYRTVTGRKFYPAAVQAIIDKRDVYEGKTGFPQIIEPKGNGCIAHTLEPVEIREGYHAPVEKDKKEERIEPEDTIIKVERALRGSAKGLSLYQIQDVSGVADLDAIISALEELRLSGKIDRSWSRKLGGRSIYTIRDSCGSSVESVDLISGKNASDIIEEGSGCPSDHKIESEIIRVLQMTQCPLTIESIKRKSLILSSLDNDSIRQILTGLISRRLVKEYCFKSNCSYEYITSSHNESKTITRYKSVEESKKSVGDKSLHIRTLEKSVSSDDSALSLDAGQHRKGDIDQSPYGYRIHDGVISIVEDEARVIRRVFELYSRSEGISSQAVADILNQEGFTTRTGCQIRANLVLKIWGNRDLYSCKRIGYLHYPAILFDGIGGSNMQKTKETLKKAEVISLESKTKSVAFKDANGSMLAGILIRVLRKREMPLPLSEILTIEPSLSKYKRSLVVSALRELVEKGTVSRVMDRNSYGAVVLKYKLISYPASVVSDLIICQLSDAEKSESGDKAIVSDRVEALESKRKSEQNTYHKTQEGTFRSWTVLDQYTAVKTCDDDFIFGNASGVPKGMCGFFDADDFVKGQSCELRFIYENRVYSASVSADSTPSRRIKIRWEPALGKVFKRLNQLDAISKVSFHRCGDKTYELTVL